MTSKKLGALIRSVPPATVSAVEIPEAPPAATLNAPLSTVDSVLPVAAVPPPHTASHSGPAPIPEVAPQREVALQVMVPVAIRRQLAMMAADQGKSLRSLILQAVCSLGIEVDEQEIKGRRSKRM